jgi:hypothetical protein
VTLMPFAVQPRQSLERLASFGSLVSNLRHPPNPITTFTINKNKTSSQSLTLPFSSESLESCFAAVLTASAAGIRKLKAGPCDSDVKFCLDETETSPLRTQIMDLGLQTSNVPVSPGLDRTATGGGSLVVGFKHCGEGL